MILSADQVELVSVGSMGLAHSFGGSYRANALPHVTKKPMKATGSGLGGGESDSRFLAGIRSSKS